MNRPASKTSLHLFCGIGGDALGFAAAGFAPTCMDFDADAVAGARYLLGDAARVIQADLAAMEPAELARLVPECPDVVVMSPPCQGNSGCLPAKLAATAKYQALNSLGARALFLVTTTAEVCWGKLPAFVLVENVPRITTRSAELVAEMKAVLHASGFLTSEGFHDCGELGGLAQRRKRWLLAGRNPTRVQARLQLPPSKPHLTIWDVLSTVPAPTGGDGGPMHAMPGISDLNALRLAAIPPGKDWRALPERLRLVDSESRHSGYLGVQAPAEPSNTVIGNTKGCNAWGAVADPRMGHGSRAGNLLVGDPAEPSVAVIAQADSYHGANVADTRIGAGPNKQPGPYGVHDHNAPSHTILATARMDTGWASVCDPRTSKVSRSGPYGVEDAHAPSGAVIASADVTCGSFAWADPRLPERSGRLNGGFGVEDAREPAHAVVSTNKVDVTWASVTEPRLASQPAAKPKKSSKHNGHLGVQDGDDPARTIIGALRAGNGWGSVADVRVGCDPREGSYGVADGARPLPTSVIGAAITQNGPWSWPDPRTTAHSGGFAPTHRLALGEDGVLELLTLDGSRPLDLSSTSPRADVVIVALDGSYHRPMTDLELALLQGFPSRVRGEWLAIPGSREARRRGIGNAIPPLTARAIADACLEAIANTNPLAALLTPSDRDVWVDGHDDDSAERWFGAQPEETHL